MTNLPLTDNELSIVRSALLEARELTYEACKFMDGCNIDEGQDYIKELNVIIERIDSLKGQE